MATAVPVRVAEPLTGEGPAVPEAMALVRADAPAADVSLGSDPVIAAIPVELDVSVPVRNFRVRNLLALADGQIVESCSGHSDDLPLAAGGVRLAWCEFEVVDTQLAVRLTRLD